MSDKNNVSSVTDTSDSEMNLRTMYKDYFLDYASYVILERAVPSIEDGLKPVQRRILYALRKMDDGRYHKVANVIGQTMQYHPHGDASIGDALVNLGQKDLLIDPQGNWGDARTGDSAAAARYIEARLTKFALEVAFNPQTTEWQLSYDGRNQEPINLPLKFPLLLAQGAEGIAVGLSTKILPHNFIEILKASIKILQDKPFKIYPDFLTGGSVDVSDYNKGKRGGRVKIRAKIRIEDKNTLIISELPFGTTTTQLMESIVKANDKGKIKIKRVEDITAKDVEIHVELAPGVSPDLSRDALFAFTNCEMSVSPNACVIVNDKPYFLTVDDILIKSTENTKKLLELELDIKKNELLEKLHFLSLEKIFIENRVYHEIEEAESWQEVLKIIEIEMRKYISTPSTKENGQDDRLELVRDLTQDDIIKLTEIRIKRISKFNTFAAEEKIVSLKDELAEVNHNIFNSNQYTIDYFQNLINKYGAGRDRKTEIVSFDQIQATEVVFNNAKLYVNKKEGFIGTGLKKDEYVMDCSDIDDIIVVRKNGIFKVVRVADKVFIGKDIIHTAVWKKGDDRTTYNMLYVDGKTGRTMAKRYNVAAITREKEYDLTVDHTKSKVLYFTANPNGESEVVTIQLSPSSAARNKVFDFDFAELAIKGRGSKGNIVTKYPVRKVTQKEVGASTLGALKVYMDMVSGRLNTEGRGKFLGEFDTGDQILSLYKDGSYMLSEFDLTKSFEAKTLIEIAKYDPKKQIIAAVYWDGDKEQTTVKRFKIETTTTEQMFNFLTEHKQSKLYFASIVAGLKLNYTIRVGRGKEDHALDLDNFIDIKGWKSIGNKLTENKIISIKPIKIKVNKQKENKPPKENKAESKKKDYKPGDSLEFDL